MLSIDEAIEDLKYDIEIDMYIRNIAPQIAEWLEELKDYQDKNKMVVRVDVENMDSIKDKIEELSKYAERQYDKAIDDFAENVRLYYSLKQEMGYVATTYEDLINYIFELAEQLKAGGVNGKERS